MRVDQTQAKEGHPTQQIAFIVYIAGVHVPVVSVTLAMSIGAFPVLTITLPATADLIKLGDEDRAPVVVFFLDKWYSPKDLRLGVTPTWRLLFDGDINGWSYTKGINSKNISFSVVSHMAALNAMSIMYMAGKGNELLSSVSTSSVEKLTEAVKQDMQSLSFYTKGLYGTGNIKRPIDFVKNLLLGVKIGGAPHEKGTPNERRQALQEIDESIKELSSNKVSGSNFTKIRRGKGVAAAMEFFIKYNHRNRLDKRWIASPVEDLGLSTSGAQNSDSSEKNKVAVKNTKETKEKEIPNDIFTSVVSRITIDALSSRFKSDSAPTADFWSMITKFYQHTWYEILILPTAQYVKVYDEEDKNVGNTNSEDVPIDGEPTTASARLANCISMPQVTYALPPACNVITPAMTTRFSYAENYSIQNTRTIVNGYSAFGSIGNKVSRQRMLEMNALRFGYPTDQEQVLSKANVYKKGAENLLVYPEEYFKGPVVTRPQAPSFYLALEHSTRYTHNSVDKEAAKKAQDTINAATGTTPSKEQSAILIRDRKWRQEMLYSFAKSYFLESKYQHRNGTIQMNFNPYLVPGLPFAMIDDNDDEQLHLTGVITSVNISMSTVGASTSVSYSAGRTLKETYEQVFIENTFGPEGDLVDIDTTSDTFDMYTTAPIMPLKVLADQLQTDENAAKYYQRLLYTNDTVNNKIKRSMVFRHDNYFYPTKGSTLKTILKSKNIDIGDTLATKLTGKGDKTFPGTITEVTPNTSKTYFGKVDLELNVKDSQLASINSYEESMQRAARPICSLDDYMQMFNTKEDYLALKNGVTDDEFGTPYPLTIRTYHVDEDLDAGYIRPYSRDPETLGTNAPELRRNWPARLRKYRNRIKNNHIVKR